MISARPRAEARVESTGLTAAMSRTADVPSPARRLCGASTTSTRELMMSDDYTVPKEVARVTLHPPGIETKVFLSHSARLHAGHETIFDLITSEKPFLPTYPQDGVVLFRKDQLSWIRIHDPLENEESFFETAEYARRLPVHLVFADGGELRGSFVVVAPDESSRVSDIANSAERSWLHFEDDQDHYLVNLSRMRSITPVGDA